MSVDADEIFAGLDAAGTWAAVIDAEPALTVVLSESSSTRRCWRSPTYVDLKSPYTLGHSRAVAELAAGRGHRSSDSPRTRYGP